MENIETIKIKYHADIDEIDYIGGPGHSAWIDLRAAENVTMKAGEYKAISLGISMQLPDGFEALIAPRSSTFRKYGILLVNGLGIVDPSFDGDGDIWHFPAYATRDTYIPFNDRICQFRILEVQPLVGFDRVFTLGNPDRGGLGSSGRA